MKKIIVAVMMIWPTLSFAQAGTFVIDGKMETTALITGKMYLAYNDNGEEMRDSSMIISNTYHFERSIKDGAVRVNLTCEDRTKPQRERFKGSAQFYVGREEVKLVSNELLGEAVITGALVENDSRMIKKRMKTENRPEKEIQIDFINNHPDSWLSFVFLNNMVIYNSSITLDEADALYTKLGPSVKKYSQVRYIKQFIDARRTAVVGKPAPVFTAMDINDRPVVLSSYKGKYVFIDFWASWCHPCRAENPVVSAAYQKFRDKGFNILGVSLDTGKEAWLKAVKQDNLAWPQVSNLKGWEDEAAVKYGIHAIPSNFLVNPDGIIIAMNLRGPELEGKLAEIFK